MLLRSSLIKSCWRFFSWLLYLFEAVEGIIELGSEIVERFNEFFAHKAVALVVRILNFVDKIFFEQSWVNYYLYFAVLGQWIDEVAWRQSTLHVEVVDTHLETGVQLSSVHVIFNVTE